MSDYFRPYAAVFPVHLRGEGAEREVLLHLRQNTGYMDGRWDFIGSGHIEEGESAKQAVIRESMEEAGLTIRMEDIHFAHVAYRVGGNGLRTYCDYYFLISRYSGTPIMAEPDKCAALRWLRLNDLPDDMIPLRRSALESILRGNPYDEYLNEP